jgi:hypothetical protein
MTESKLTLNKQRKSGPEIWKIQGDVSETAQGRQARPIQASAAQSENRSRARYTETHT